MQTITNNVNWTLSMKSRERLINLISIALVFLFIYTAVNKLIHYQVFEYQIAQMPTFAAAAGILTWLIPAIELIVCLMLAFSPTRLAGLTTSFILLIIFSLYVLIILNFSERVPYADGALFEAIGWTGHLILNLFSIGLTYLAINLKLESDFYKQTGN